MTARSTRDGGVPMAAVVAAAATATVAAVMWMAKRRSAGSALDRGLKEAAATPPRDVDAAGKPLTKAGIHSLRNSQFCPAQSVSYANVDPLLVVRGEGARLYDERGRSFLDTRNNVGHCGHSCPAVVKAIASQAAALNTNMRYLHPNHVVLAQKLLAKCPAPLDRVFFVNSGSEANDLAIRLARTKTNHEEIICVQHAYHGHTHEVINISPYKFNHKGGKGQKPWVHVVDAPDTFRGAHREDDPEAGPKYAQQVADTCEQIKNGTAGTGGGVAAFFIESGMSVAGVILPPTGYLKKCYEAVRAAGGVCVADEVQVGFGRMGSSFWGFQQQGVVPDIITMGKPFGNGMPLAAVVTTSEIADAFHNGLEYFNTFGGNPVVCAAGIAVLDFVESEGLQAHAARVGEYMRRRLRELAAKHEIIGDVRGEGLFIGIDFVKDRATRAPAAAECSVICSRLKDDFLILTSCDGPDENVLVVKPPMVFNEADVDETMDALGHVLATLGEIDQNAARTPT